MGVRRHGTPTAFWGTTINGVPTAEAVLAGGKSRAMLAGQDADQVVIYINVDAATTITIQVAHGGALTAEGNNPDQSTAPADAFFYPLKYLGTATTSVFGAAGTVAYQVPDWGSSWVRLVSSGAATILAGIEISAT